jgi:hypothetical protein
MSALHLHFNFHLHGAARWFQKRQRGWRTRKTLRELKAASKMRQFWSAVRRDRFFIHAC